MSQQPGQQLGQPRDGGLIPGVGPGAQDLLGPVRVAALGQQLGQPPGGPLVAGGGPGLQDLDRKSTRRTPVTV